MISGYSRKLSQNLTIASVRRVLVIFAAARTEPEARILSEFMPFTSVLVNTGSVFRLVPVPRTVALIAGSGVIICHYSTRTVCVPVCTNTRLVRSSPINFSFV